MGKGRLREWSISRKEWDRLHRRGLGIAPNKREIVIIKDFNKTHTSIRYKFDIWGTPVSDLGKDGLSNDIVPNHPPDCVCQELTRL